MNPELIEHRIEELNKNFSNLNKNVDIILDRLNMISSIKTDIASLKMVVDDHKEIIDGKGGKMGLKSKVDVIWNIWVWVLCTVSAGTGSVITWGIYKLFQR